jgi:hypothetical protein
MTDPLARLTAALADRYRIERELGAGEAVRFGVFDADCHSPHV